MTSDKAKWTILRESPHHKADGLSNEYAVVLCKIEDGAYVEYSTHVRIWPHYKGQRANGLGDYIVGGHYFTTYRHDESWALQEALSDFETRCWSLGLDPGLATKKEEAYVP